jgi:hypothetical protein
MRMLMRMLLLLLLLTVISSTRLNMTNEVEHCEKD